MRKPIMGLAVAALLVGGLLARAEGEPAAPAPETAVAPGCASCAAGQAEAALPAMPAPGCGCGCDQDRGTCYQRLLNWFTYCPPRTKCCCHSCCGCGGCGCDGGGCGGHQCTPCCTQVYMYFLDRCSCTLGYHGGPCPPPCVNPYTGQAITGPISVAPNWDASTAPQAGGTGPTPTPQ